jgi:hypothetical protein
MTWAIWNLVSVRWDTVFMTVQDRSMDWVECTIGLGIILDASIVFLGDDLNTR